jgi:hypothetical protein
MIERLRPTPLEWDRVVVVVVVADQAALPAA